MKITVRHRNGVAILALHGRMELPADAPVRHAVQEALDTGARKILLDLGRVPSIGSGGVGELVRMYTSTAKRGGRLKLSSLRPNVLDIIQMVQLHQVFEIFESEDEAVASFQDEALRGAASA